MYKVILIPAAKQDIREAAIWYNSQQTGLGKKFTSDIRNKIATLRQNPFAYSVRYENVRTVVLDIFPFMVHFTVNKDSVLISAVLHTSLDPEKWIKRLTP